MTKQPYDAIIIGGGPGGSTAATYLAKAGKRVLLLEKEKFPRFHIGESLLPYCQELLGEMGVLPKLELAGFPRKKGAQFHLGNCSKSLYFVFAEGKYTRHCETYQVERARFDHILLQHAAACGAEVREDWAVQKYQTHCQGVWVEARDAANNVERFEAAFLIDASGRANLTGNQEQIRVVHPRLKKLALFAHFEGVKLDAGAAGGDTVIIRLADKWFWIIPVSNTKTSVGCVMDQAEFAAQMKTPGELFQSLWKSTPAMVERLGQAVAIGSVQATSDFSYYNKKYVGERLLRVGDAAGFMDPIFSAGVYLAMYSGRLAAHSIQGPLATHASGRAELKRYERKIRRGVEFYWEMVEHFYTTPFIEIFFHPREKFHLVSAVNAALAGELDGGWRIRWRMRLFFLLVKVQARFGLVPRLNLA
jgi:flavin-dependent dehydrogenase